MSFFSLTHWPLQQSICKPHAGEQPPPDDELLELADELLDDDALEAELADEALEAELADDVVDVELDDELLDVEPDDEALDADDALEELVVAPPAPDELDPEEAVPVPPTCWVSVVLPQPPHEDLPCGLEPSQPVQDTPSARATRGEAQRIGGASSSGSQEPQQ